MLLKLDQYVVLCHLRRNKFVSSSSREHKQQTGNLSNSTTKCGNNTNDTESKNELAGTVS